MVAEILRVVDNEIHETAQFTHLHETLFGSQMQRLRNENWLYQHAIF
jgi:hypothetical protein